MAGFLAGMERLKQRIHGSKIPLSKRGQNIMLVTYMVVPLIGGCAVMNWAMNREHDNRSWQAKSALGPHALATPAMTIDDINQDLRAVQK